jgi:hypothetical protein
MLNWQPATGIWMPIQNISLIKKIFELATGNWILVATSTVFLILTQYVEMATGNWYLGVNLKYLDD